MTNDKWQMANLAQVSVGMVLYNWLMQQELISNSVFSLIVVMVVEFVRMVGEAFIRSARKNISSNRAQTLVSLGKNTLKFILWFAGLGIILSRWGVDVSPLIAGAGVAGIAVGFGAQTLVRDVLSGVFVIAEDYINVGDEVELGGKKGKVVSVRLRTVVLKDEKSGETHIIPNSMIGVITKYKNK